MQENFIHQASKRLSKYMFQSVFEDMTELCMRTKGNYLRIVRDKESIFSHSDQYGSRIS